MARRTGDTRHQSTAFRNARPVLETAELGSVTAHRIRFGAGCTGPHVLAPAPGQHALVLSARGETRIARGGREVVVQGEAVALCDTRHPLHISPRPATRTAEAVVMLFPGSAVPMTQTETVPAQPEISDVTGSGSLLRAFLVEAATLASLSAHEAARLGDAALHLAAAVLEAYFFDAGETRAQTQQQELMTRIRGFIDRNLGDPDLTPSLVASAHHISIRCLQRLFKAEGSTPSEWIRQRRLDNSRRELCDVSLRSASIREIGLRNGFAQASDFSRVFRGRYGVPPGKFRDDWFRWGAISQ
ncbi:AraC family transcriptional regulator [Streptomyces sp. SID7499]|uniref:AraC family transcriptional regulator n=1 Tax=Streptomyces sp. SID7499 TaxID=2706086 RepID=A0A6G3X941_9ACTN|nr:AraC family transcriptional regulator [Streptomyces sp. SID7499]